jgi:putative hemolysin
MMLWFSLALLALLALLSLALASVEAAFYLMKRRRLGHLALQNPRAEIVNRYLEDPPLLLMPVHIGTYTAHVAMTVVITSLLLDSIHHWAIPVAFASMCAYLILFRLTLPYAVVRRNPERSLLILLPAFDRYAVMLAPLVRALRKRTGPENGSAMPPDEDTLVPELPPPAALDENERRLEESLARFSETIVRQVMTPRPDIIAVSATAPVSELRRVMVQTKYSRIPVYGDNLDDIVGVAVVRDLMEYDQDESDPVLPLVRAAFLVPETKRIADLLRELQEKRTPFAVVIDEYGGTAGLVTVEDIVEELVGEIKDEYDIETEPITVEPDGAVLVAGRVNVDRLEQALEVPLAEAGEIGTVGGLVTTVFGRIPRAGERVDYRGFILEVVDAERKRVNRVRFRRRPVEAQA